MRYISLHFTYFYLLLTSESKSQTASISFQPFLHSSLQRVRVLYNGQQFPLKIAPFHRGI